MLVRGLAPLGYTRSRYISYIYHNTTNMPIDVTCEYILASVSQMLYIRDRYRLVRTYFAQTIFWREYDPFRIQKEQTFRSSASAVYRKPQRS